MAKKLVSGDSSTGDKNYGNNNSKQQPGWQPAVQSPF